MKTILKFGGILHVVGKSSCCWKAFSELDEFILHSSQLRCGRYGFFNGFCCWKFKQIAKLKFGKKNQLSPQCVHTWANSTSYTSSHKKRVVYVWRCSYTRGFSWGSRTPSGSHPHVAQFFQEKKILLNKSQTPIFLGCPVAKICWKKNFGSHIR